MANNWPRLVPFDEHLAPDFPISALPDQLAEYVCQVAESFQVPIDFPATLVLATLGASITKLVEVRLSPDWHEPPNLFVLIVMNSGDRKSAVYREIVRPIEIFERNSADRSTDRPDGRTAEPLPANLRPAGRPAERLLADDVTPEKLVSLLALNSGRIALMSPEGGAFETMAGRYSNGVANLDVYLKGYSGDPIRVDRKNSETEIVQSPNLTIAITSQPETLNELASKPEFRGRGLLARFIYCYPKSLMGSRKIEVIPIEEPLRNQYYGLVNTLLTQRERLGQRVGDPISLILSKEADERFKDFRAEIETQLAPEKELGTLADWGGKLPGAVARIAGIIHAIQDHEQGFRNPVSVKTISDAIQIGRYAIGQALFSFDKMGIDPAIEGARRILTWLSRKPIRSFSERAVLQDNKWFKRAASLKPALAVLIERGYIRLLTPPVAHADRGRPPGPVYEVSPEFNFALREKSQNSQKSVLTTVANKVSEFCRF